ncbi:MAG: DUF3592 domain-containing protein [bacterium]|nr:DUF3592 domain-containing protein [bacterium]
MAGKLPVIVGAIFASIGIVVLIGGIKMLYSTKNFTKIAQETRGIVTGFDENISTKEDQKTRKVSSSTAYYPKIRFTDTKGRQVEFVSKYGHSDPGIIEGDTVSVLYDPDHPSNAKWNTKMAIWFGPGVNFKFLNTCYS